jgi:malate dehydrogenase
MHDVAILGAGELGAELARALAHRDFVGHIQLIDDAGEVARGKALDIAQSAPLEGFSARVSGSADSAKAAGSRLIVLADRHGRGEWEGPEGLAVLQRLTHVGSRPVIVCSGSRQRELIERAARELRLPRTRLIGSAPEALASALRALVALEVDGSPTDVSLSVLGVPPEHVVVPWDDVAIAGVAAGRLLDLPARRRLDERVAALWPPGTATLAWAAVSAIEAIVGRSRRTLSCFVAADDTMGRRRRASAVSVKLGPDGVVTAQVPSLSGRDAVALDNATLE